MWGLVNGITALFDGVIGLFGRWHPLLGLSVVSIVTGVIMLVIFRFTSNQDAIARTKQLIKAYILEIRLFKDDLRMQFAAQRRILFTNLKYMRYALTPMLVMLIPVLVILIQLDVRYARRPFRTGETTVVKVEVEEGTPLASLEFAPPPGIVVETEPVRIEEEGGVSWRIRAEKEGELDLLFRAGGEEATKRIEVGDRLTKLAEVRAKPNFLEIWAQPSEAPLPGGSVFRAIKIDYPDRDMRLLGFGLHWLLVFFVVSVAFGFAIKGAVGVEV